MENRRYTISRCAAVLFISLGSAVISTSSNAYAGGVHFDFGVDVQPPGFTVAPPEASPPPMVVESPSLPPPVLVERMPVVVYDEPLVVERRSSVY